MFLVPLLQCKKLVFEYAPIILINAEQFLEANDMCTILHACDAEAVVSEEVSLGTEASMHAASQGTDLNQSGRSFQCCKKIAFITLCYVHMNLKTVPRLYSLLQLSCVVNHTLSVNRCLLTTTHIFIFSCILSKDVFCSGMPTQNPTPTTQSLLSTHTHTQKPKQVGRVVVCCWHFLLDSFNCL